MKVSQHEGLVLERYQDNAKGKHRFHSSTRLRMYLSEVILFNTFWS